MKIHRKKFSKSTATKYYFTKNRNECLVIEHDTKWDFGPHSTSGADLEVKIHYQNSWIKEELEEIPLEEVPQVVRDVLTYLS